MAVYDETLSDGLGLAEPALLTGWPKVLADGLGLDESALLTGWVKTLSSTLGVLDYPAVGKLVLVALSETLGLAPTDAQLRGVHLREALALNPDLAANQYVRLVLAEAAAFGSMLNVGLPVALSDTVATTSTLGVQLALTLAETLGLAPALLGAAQYHTALSDGVGIDPELVRFLGASLSDTLGLAETVAAAARAYSIIEEHLGLADTITPLLLMRVELAEGLEITHTEAISALYNGVLEDGIELTAAYLSPGGGFTTWAMNTRTGAVTEYSNFAFNSFAQLGGRYVGATDDGLYELIGDDDDGEDIIARLKGGFLQFGGTKLSRLKAAYIATRGGGVVVLKIVEGDGTEYVYQVETQDMRTAKFNMGKGQRARYFSYELTTVGQDFDLETLEFVPIVVQRRV